METTRPNLESRAELQRVQAEVRAALERLTQLRERGGVSRHIEPDVRKAADDLMKAIQDLEVAWRFAE